jgi:hypothetical protein
MATETRLRSRTYAGGRDLNIPLALASGVALVFLGVAGVLMPGFRLAIGPDGFPLTMLHNLLPVAAGAVLVAAGILGARQARFANRAVGVGYVAFLLIGPAVTGTPPVALDVIHLALGVVLVAVGFRGRP